MPLINKPSSVAHISLIYVTAGALIIVWAAIEYFYLGNHPPGQGSTAYYWCTGFLVTGLALLAIGLGLGRLGRAARQAELPPHEVTPAVAQTDQLAAAAVAAQQVAQAQAAANAPAPILPAVAAHGTPVLMPAPPVAAQRR